MVQTRSAGLLAAFLLVGIAAAQTITGDVPPVLGFVDISASGGTSISGAQDDSEHNIVTTVGNAFFPAGNVRIGNNGVAITGLTTGDVGFTNMPIPASGVPTNLPPGGASYLCVLWDDHVPYGDGNSTIWWRQADGVLTILWKGEAHFSNPVGAGVTTFEVQVFSNPGCGPAVQFLYPDTTYSFGNALNHGSSATIGFVVGTNPTGANTQFSFDLADAVLDGAVVSLVSSGAFTITPASPLGPGSLRVDLTGGGECDEYFLAVTLHQGAFPNGWLFGVDIPFVELANEIAIGAPYVGPLTGGNAALGPVGGLPSFTFYAVGLTIPFFGVHTPAVSYTIP